MLPSHTFVYEELLIKSMSKLTTSKYKLPWKTEKSSEFGRTCFIYMRIIFLSLVFLEINMKQSETQVLSFITAMLSKCCIVWVKSQSRIWIHFTEFGGGTVPRNVWKSIQREHDAGTGKYLKVWPQAFSIYFSERITIKSLRYLRFSREWKFRS